uniref:PspA/IM30 family protein n=2 Tax=Ditylum brightwellii TaxID=49249 RepID=A0A7S4S1F4_9STRA
MNQAVLDMQSDLVKIRKSYAEVNTSQRRLLHKKEEAQANADIWYQRAQLALKNGKEQLARDALIQREHELEVMKTIQSQMDTQGVATKKLYEGIKVLDAKIREANSKKEQYIARAKAAESTQKINDMLSGMTGMTSMDAFKRMEEKVEALEAAAEASAEMTLMEEDLLLSSSKLELDRKFMLFESSAAVDDELKKMKQNLLSESFHTKVPENYESSAEFELEIMRNKICDDESFSI